MEITTIHLDMVQSVALAIISYYIGAGIFAAENLRHCRFYL